MKRFLKSIIYTLIFIFLITLEVAVLWLMNYLFGEMVMAIIGCVLVGLMVWWCEFNIIPKDEK